MQTALGFLYLSAVSLIALTVSKQISQVNVVYHCGNSDQMALPSGHPQAFREKGLTQTLNLAFICADFLNSTLIHKKAMHSFKEHIALLIITAINRERSSWELPL